MQDIQVIVRSNYAAFNTEITAAHAAGKSVVLEYDGLHVIGHKVLETRGDAHEYVKTFTASAEHPGQRAEVLAEVLGA